MRTRETVNTVCAAIRKYSPITNLVLWVVTAALFIFLHQDLKRHNLQLYEIASQERMELFEERDRMIIRLMEVRAANVQQAMDQLAKNYRQMEHATKLIDEAAAQRKEQMAMIKEILNRLPEKDTQ